MLAGLGRCIGNAPINSRFTAGSLRLLGRTAIKLESRAGVEPARRVLQTRVLTALPSRRNGAPGTCRSLADRFWRPAGRPLLGRIETGCLPGIRTPNDRVNSATPLPIGTVGKKGQRDPEGISRPARSYPSVVPSLRPQMERPVGLEPTFTAWKAVALPLDDGRKMVPSHRIERYPPRLQRGARTSYANSAVFW